MVFLIVRIEGIEGTGKPLVGLLTKHATYTEKDSESYAEHATYTEKESYKQACFPQESRA